MTKWGKQEESWVCKKAVQMMTAIFGHFALSVIQARVISMTIA